MQKFENQERELFFRLLLHGMQSSEIAQNSLSTLFYWLLPPSYSNIQGRQKERKLVAGIAEELAVACKIESSKDCFRFSMIVFIVEDRMDDRMQKEFLSFLRNLPIEIDSN